MDLEEKNAVTRLRLLPALLAALLVFSVLALLWFGRFQRQIEVPVQMAEKMTRQSSEMDKAVGRSFTRGRIVIGTFAAARDNGTADVTIRIFGPRGQGKLYEWAQETNGSWQICHLCFARTTAPKRFLLFLTSPATVNENDEVTVNVGGLNRSVQHYLEVYLPEFESQKFVAGVD